MHSLPRHDGPYGLLLETEVATIRSELTQGEWTFCDERHRSCVLQAGRGCVHLPDGDLPFAAPCVISVPAGYNARMHLEAGSRGISLAVTEVDLARAVPVGPNAGQIRAALSRPMILGRLDARHARRLAETLEAIAEEARQDWPATQECMRHHLALFFIATWRLSGPVLRETLALPSTIVHRFLHAVEMHLRDHWTIARYAAEVETTADRLNTIVRRSTGRSPLSLIHSRMIMEADALLDDSRLQVREIAEELGFHDPAYFSRFYKRQTGRSPNRQRREFTSEDYQAGAHFAAWP
ncbi:MAG: helix-turn-helix domain-containing protein [Pseudorhizobium sp.]